MSTDQEYWDACLIKTWRNNGTVGDAFDLYKSITGKDVEPPLIRIPIGTKRPDSSIQAFVANRLEKISKRLWSQPPEKDVLLLRKLKDSKYDISERSTHFVDREFVNAKKRNYKDEKKMKLEYHNYKNRNHSTDWGVTK